MSRSYSLFFFFNDTATTEIYTLSLHDALPIYPAGSDHTAPGSGHGPRSARWPHLGRRDAAAQDRKSTRLNSSHSQISYAVFCLKKKNNTSLLQCAVESVRRILRRERIAILGAR